MLDETARLTNYLGQTGKQKPTARQRRRIAHKRNHQSQEAAAHREGVATARFFATAARARRRASLPA